ncbi:MAG: AEC family transporter [Oscillospiraceae bacterium]
MDSIILSFNVVSPLCLLMIVGYFIKKIDVFTKETLDKLNVLIFKILLPALLFKNIYDSEMNLLKDIRIIVISSSLLIVFLIICMIIVPLIIKDKEKIGVVIQGMFRSNFVIFGIPLTSMLFGPENIYLATITMPFIITILNIGSIIVLEVYRDRKISLKSFFKSIYNNNLIRAVFLGIIFSSFKIELPMFLEKTISDISVVTTPLALMVLGGCFQFDGLLKNKKPLIVSILGRLVFMPIITLPIAIMLGLRNEELGVILVMSCSPTAVSAFSMAKEMDADYELAGQIVATTCFLCTFTLFIFITILKMTNFI